MQSRRISSTKWIAVFAAVVLLVHSKTITGLPLLQREASEGPAESAGITNRPQTVQRTTRQEKGAAEVDQLKRGLWVLTSIVDDLLVFEDGDLFETIRGVCSLKDLAEALAASENATGNVTQEASVLQAVSEAIVNDMLLLLSKVSNNDLPLSKLCALVKIQQAAQQGMEYGSFETGNSFSDWMNDWVTRVFNDQADIKEWIQPKLFDNLFR